VFNWNKLCHIFRHCGDFSQCSSSFSALQLCVFACHLTPLNDKPLSCSLLADSPPASFSSGLPCSFILYSFFFFFFRGWYFFCICVFLSFRTTNSFGHIASASVSCFFLGQKYFLYLFWMMARVKRRGKVCENRTKIGITGGKSQQRWTPRVPWGHTLCCHWACHEVCSCQKGTSLFWGFPRNYLHTKTGFKAGLLRPQFRQMNVPKTGKRWWYSWFWWPHKSFPINFPCNS